MRTCCVLTFIASLSFCLCERSGSADVILTTSTLDNADIDLDGPGLQTDGDVPGGPLFSFTFSGNEVPAQFVDIDSFTITIRPEPDTSISARAGAGIPPGIGILFADGNDPEAIGSLDNDSMEQLYFELTYTTSNPGQNLFFTGVAVNSFSATASQGALQGGATTNNGQILFSGIADPLVAFDIGVDNFSVLSEGTDSFRIAGLQLGSTIQGVPEPGTAWAILALVAATTIRHKRLG